MGKVTKGKKVGAFFLLAVSVGVMLMVASGDFDFEYGFFGWIVMLGFAIWSIVILVSKTYNMKKEDNPELRNKAKEVIEEFGKTHAELDEDHIAFFPSIPKPWLDVALKKFAKAKADFEEALFFFNDGLYTEGKKGILLTEQFLYYKLDNNNQTWKKGQFPLREIADVKFEKDKLYVNGEYCGNISDKEQAKIARNTIEKVLELHKN